MSKQLDMFERWIIDEVDETVVPDDEGNIDGLIYNLIMLWRHGNGYDRYDNKPGQKNLIEEWRKEITTEQGTLL